MEARLVLSSMKEKGYPVSKYFEEMDKKIKKEAELKALRLAIVLHDLGRSDDLKRASEDDNYLNQLYKEFNIQ
jgi:hypothetical protein